MDGEPSENNPQQDLETEVKPVLKVVFLGRNSNFLGFSLQKEMEEVKLSPMHLQDYSHLRKSIPRWGAPRVIVADSTSPNLAKEFNDQGISIIVLNQRRRDYDYLISENPERKTNNEVISVEPIDFEAPEVLLKKVAKTIRNLTR